MRTPKIADQDFKASRSLWIPSTSQASTSSGTQRSPLGGTTAAATEASMVDYPMMATPVHSHMQVTQLYHELRGRFPEVPEHVVRKSMEKHGNNLEKCVNTLQQESNFYLYGQQQPSDSGTDAVTDRLASIQVAEQRARIQAPGRPGPDSQSHSGSTDTRITVSSAGGDVSASTTQSVTTYSVAITPGLLQHSQSAPQYMSTHQQFVTPPNTAPAVPNFDPFLQTSQPTNAQVPQTGCRVYNPNTTTTTPSTENTSQLVRQSSHPEIHIHFRPPQPYPKQTGPSKGPGGGNQPASAYYPYQSPGGAASKQPQNTSASLHYQHQGWQYGTPTLSSGQGQGHGQGHNPTPSRPEQFGQGFPQPPANGNYSSPGTGTPSPRTQYAQNNMPSPLQLRLPYPGVYGSPSAASPPIATAGSGGQHASQQPSSHNAFSSSTYVNLQPRPPGTQVPGPGLYSPTGPVGHRMQHQQSSGSSCSGTPPPPNSLGAGYSPYTPPQQPQQAWPSSTDIMNRMDPMAAQLQQPLQPLSLSGGDRVQGLGPMGVVDFNPGVSASMPPVEYGRPGRSGSISEDQRYAEALLMHQRARMEKLIKDHHENLKELDRLRKDVRNLEQQTWERTQARSNGFLTADDVKKMWDENRNLQINIQLLTREKDMLDSGDMPLGHHLDPKELTGFYTHIQPGQRGSIHSSTGEITSLPPVSSAPAPSNNPRTPPPRPPPPAHPPNTPLPFPDLLDPYSSHTPVTTQRSHPTENEEEEEEPGMWSCRACTFRNHPAMNKCEMCEIPRVDSHTEGAHR